MTREDGLQTVDTYNLGIDIKFQTCRLRQKNQDVNERFLWSIKHEYIVVECNSGVINFKGLVVMSMLRINFATPLTREFFQSNDMAFSKMSELDEPHYSDIWASKEIRSVKLLL